MNNIKEILEKKGVKQTWLAEKLNKSYNMVNSYVQNRRQPSLGDLFKIADILGVEAKELIDSVGIVSDKKNKDNICQLSGEEDPSYAQTTKIPLLGRVACGNPFFAEENIEAYIPVSNQLIKSSNKYFILKAFGDSMNEAGINDGNFVLIKQQQTAQNGDKVVALIDDDATIKEFNNNGNMIVLKPRSTNKKHQPIILTTDFKIQGVVITVIPI
jgi:repressor LexA